MDQCLHFVIAVAWSFSKHMTLNVDLDFSKCNGDNLEQMLNIFAKFYGRIFAF